MAIVTNTVMTMFSLRSRCSHTPSSVSAAFDPRSAARPGNGVQGQFLG